MKRVMFLCTAILAINLVAAEAGNAQGGNAADSLFYKYENNRSVTYREAISLYRRMAEQYREASLLEYGKTDAGRRLHLFVIDKDGLSSPAKIKQRGRSVLLVNNGIHPGEPCGIDGSVALAHEILEGKASGEVTNALDEITVAFVPVYNIGGALNRGCCSRANQNGPEAYGFRGNARNLDLNRDFIKADSRNARSFSRLFQEWSPALFLDTHSTDGADYQHVMTLIETQVDKLHNRVSAFMADTLTPALYKGMKESGFPMMPYAHPYGRNPARGLSAMLDSPRYATGYAALFNTIGYVSETHMLKPYRQRVEATKSIIRQLMVAGAEHQEAIQQARMAADRRTTRQETYAMQWELDSTRKDRIQIQGYKAYTDTSELTGRPIQYYERSKPYSKKVPYHRYYKATRQVEAPDYYIVPQGWHGVLQRLQANEVEMVPLKKDTALQVSSYYIRNYDSRNQPYEGHYFHGSVELEKRRQKRSFLQGDMVVPVDQKQNRYIVHVLDPRAEDSFFAWNFFDEVLQQKEWFSPYVFEPMARKILARRPELQEAFEQRRSRDSTFARSNWRQLYFIYERSKYYEEEHNRYPVAGIEAGRIEPLIKPGSPLEN